VQLPCLSQIAVIFAAVALLCPTSYALQSQPKDDRGSCLFRVGVLDGSSAEFAQGQPRGNVIYTVGHSIAATDWYAFQPAALFKKGGTPEPAAASPRTIEFEIHGPLATAYQFKVALLFELQSVPALRIVINGRSGIFYPEPKLDDRMGDTSAAFDPVYSSADISFAFPGSFLHSGLNTITLQAIEEADDIVPDTGFGYDAIELDRLDGRSVDQSSARIEPTIFFRDQPGGPAELVNVTIRSTHRLTPEDTVSLLLGGTTYQAQIGISREFGEARLSFNVKEFPPRSLAKVDWHAAERGINVEQVIEPQKKWTLFMVPHIHLDVGFTDFQSKVAVVQTRAIDEALDFIANDPDFRFSVDGEWPLEQFLRTRSVKEQQRAISAIQNGQLYVPAQYANLLTGFPTAETLIRSLYPAANFSREHETPFDYANITDVPSYSWSYASILAAAGIKDFAAAANNHRAPVLRQGHLNHHSPFWWVAPDGQKIFSWYSLSYLQMSYLFGMPPILAAGEDTIPLFLQQYEHPDYAASSVIVFGTQVENNDLYPEQAQLAAKWNSKWAYPKIEYSGFYAALETIRHQFGANIPTYSGDGGPYWELGLGSDAYYVALERGNESRGPSAEKLSTIASLIDPRIAVDKAALDDMWTNMILMDEHTWGSGDSVTDPTSTEATEQLAIKDSFATRAQTSVDSLMKTAMATVAGSISAGANSIIVFNTLNWSRGGLIDLDLRKGQELFDPSSGSLVPVQILRAGSGFNSVRFVAQDVPALGYRVYRLRKATAPPVSSFPRPPESRVLESPYYKVELDAASGAVRSIYDKELRRELVDQQSRYRLGQYLYVTDANPANNQHATWYRGKLDLQIHPAQNGKILSITRTPYGWEAHMESTAINTPRITTSIRLFEHEKKLEFVEDVEKDKISAKEAVYFAFPFAINHPQFRYELQTTSMDPAKDMYPGAGHEWFSVQHWVSVQGGGLSASVLPLDVPLVTLGDIDRGQWLDTFGERRAAVFSFAMNNYWEDNYTASQGGRFRFRYIVTSAPSTDAGQLSRLGWEEVTPLEIDEITNQDKALNQPQLLDGRQGSFAQIQDSNVILDTWKPAEDHNGTILRFLDLGGQTRSLTVSLPAFRLLEAWQTDAVERNQDRLPIKDGHQFSVIMHPHEIVTVRIATDGTGFAVAQTR
jgi:alpha-mannosidase